MTFSTKTISIAVSSSAVLLVAAGYAFGSGGTPLMRNLYERQALAESSKEACQLVSTNAAKLAKLAASQSGVIMLDVDDFAKVACSKKEHE